MKRGSTLFLQIVLVLVGPVALVLLLRFPMTEGRAVGLDLWSIYADPFILYGYLASLPFFIGLYQAFTLLGYIGRDLVYSLSSVRALRKIKYCAIAQGALIVLTVLYIAAPHHADDDPAGFIAIGILGTIICAVVATAAAVFERTLRRSVETQSKSALVDK